MKKQVVSLIIVALFVIGFTNGHTFAASIYKVQNGDTLWTIAEKNNVVVEDLLNWNALQSDLIFPGQELNLGADAKGYIVKKGDTLSEIADKHQISLTDLMSKNAISSHLIYPGDELAIDGIAKSNTKSTANASTKKQAVSGPPAQNNTKTSQTPAPSGKEMTVTATAYTAYCAGCSGTTYTGINLRANPNQKVIAVDPNVIPLGSRVWVEGYGEAIAGDIGGAIKGNIIDVFLENKQDAYNWGRKTVKIKVLN